MNVRPSNGCRVAIVIPVYNAAAWIEETLNSVASQSMENLHIIAVNDGSTDNSSQILSSWRGPSTTRITIVNQKNSGVASARNTGIRAATEDFVAFLDADDIWLPKKVEQQVDYLLSNPQAIAVGCWYQIRQQPPLSRDVLVQFDWKRSSVRNWLCFQGYGALLSSTLMVRRSALLKTGLFDEHLGTTADLAFALRLIDAGECGVVQESLVGYRQHDNQMHRSSKALEDDYRYLIRSPDYLTLVGVQSMEVECCLRGYLALHHLANGHYLYALKESARLIIRSPRSLLAVWLSTAARQVARLGLKFPRPVRTANQNGLTGWQ